MHTDDFEKETVYLLSMCALMQLYKYMVTCMLMCAEYNLEIQIDSNSISIWDELRDIKMCQTSYLQ